VQWNRYCRASRIFDAQPPVERLPTDVSEAKLNGSARQRNRRDAGQLAHRLAVRHERGTGDRQRAMQLEAAERPVDVAAGANALDDLLAEIAALREVQGARLAGLLGEIAGAFGVANVGAVARRAFEDAQGFQGMRRRLRLRPAGSCMAGGGAEQGVPPSSCTTRRA
jgi:hypothetical protein